MDLSLRRFKPLLFLLQQTSTATDVVDAVVVVGRGGVCVHARTGMLCDNKCQKCCEVGRPVRKL